MGRVASLSCCRLSFERVDAGIGKKNGEGGGCVYGGTRLRLGQGVT